MDFIKTELRQRTWDAIRDSKVGRFPGIHGRIPHFIGAERAAHLVQSVPEWAGAQTIKCNPDMPQREIRRHALVDGKTVYLAVPKLVDKKPFIKLDPTLISPKDYWKASSIKGAFELGTAVSLAEMDPVDLIVTGCVAVSDDGVRLGKGGGYSDLEYALLVEHGLVHSSVTILTTVHSVQHYPKLSLPRADHDITVDLIITPDTILRVADRAPRPQGILWDALSPSKKASIPVLNHSGTYSLTKRGASFSG